MPRRRSPRALAQALGRLETRLQPDTPVARVQSTWSGLHDAWAAVVGEYVAQRARPERLRAGVLTVACTEAVVADTLALEAEDVLRRLNETLGEDPITRLRCVVSAAPR